MLPAGSLDPADHRCGPKAFHPRMAGHLVVGQVDTAGLGKESHEEAAAGLKPLLLFPFALWPRISHSAALSPGFFLCQADMAWVAGLTSHGHMENQVRLKMRASIAAAMGEALTVLSRLTPPLSYQ